MAKKEKMSDKLKEGVSIQELEDFARKYTSEVFMALAIIIATASSMFDFFTGPGWSLLFAGLGAVLTIVLPDQMSKFVSMAHNFVHKQQRSTQIIIGIVRIILGLFVPFIIFGMLGLHAGVGCHDMTKRSQMGGSNKPPSQPEDENK